jgi:hypothetical protein
MHMRRVLRCRRTDARHATVAFGDQVRTPFSEERHCSWDLRIKLF